MCQGDAKDFIGSVCSEGVGKVCHVLKSIGGFFWEGVGGTKVVGK